VCRTDARTTGEQGLVRQNTDWTLRRLSLRSGVHGAYRGQDIVVLGWLRELGIKSVAFGLTKEHDVFRGQFLALALSRR
jgi:hypothetical protein